jgi:hypothetical protein
LDFIGKFSDNSSNGYSWVLTAIDYFTKWVEAIPTKSATEKVVMDFLEDRIITRFGVPSKIVIDNAKAFCSAEMSSFCFKYGIILSHASYYEIFFVEKNWENSSCFGVGLSSNTLHATVFNCCR